MKQLNKLFNYLILLLVVGYGGFYFYGQSRPVKPSGQYEMSSNDVEKVVNKYLKQTTEDMKKEQLNSERAVFKAMKQPLVMTTKAPETNPNDIPVSKQIWKESDVQTPADDANSAVYNEMANEKLDEDARKKYSKDFIENARRGGFHVILTDDLTRIKSVTPIRRPSQQDDSVESFPSN